MNLLSPIGDAYIRWRHSHGFGVHSPFAYDLVTRVVRPGNYGYYGYDDIEDTLTLPGTRDYGRVRHDARQLLRLMVALDCRRLIHSSPVHPAFKAAARGIGGTSAPVASNLKSLRKGDLVMFSGKTLTRHDIVSILERGIPVLAVDPDHTLVGTLTSTITRGTIFKGTRKILCVPRQEMALASYLMKF